MFRTHIILADENTLMVDALKSLLQAEFEVVGTFSDGSALVEAAAGLRPDVIILDTSMPKMNGLIAGQRLREMKPDVKLIYSTMNRDQRIVAEAFRIGAKGYLLKSCTAGELIRAIRIAARGGVYVTPLMTDGVVGSFTRYFTPSRNNDELTLRQKQVLQLLAEGRSMKEVALILKVSARTIAFHKYTMMEHLQIKSNAELLRYAMKTQILAA